MALFSALGDVGSGKTLFTTYLAYYDERPVWANYNIDIPSWKKLRPEMLFSVKEPTFIIIDEAYTWLESRLSGRDINMYMSYILFQSRKRGIDIALTDQLESTIDKRFRLMTNYRIECESYGDEGFEYLIWKRGRGGYIGPASWFFPMGKAEQFFPLYDSWELINPIDDKMLYKVTEDKEETIHSVDKIVKAMLKKAPAEAWTKGTVSDYFLRNKHPFYMVDIAFNALKGILLDNYKNPKIKKA